MLRANNNIIWGLLFIITIYYLKSSHHERILSAIWKAKTTDQKTQNADFLKIKWKTRWFCLFAVYLVLLWRRLSAFSLCLGATFPLLVLPFIFILICHKSTTLQCKQCSQIIILPGHCQMHHYPIVHCWHCYTSRSQMSRTAPAMRSVHFLKEMWTHVQ